MKFFLIAVTLISCDLFIAFQNVAQSEFIRERNKGVTDSLQANITLRAVLPDAISESSGLAFSDGKLWTHNDKGGEPSIFSIDTSDGSIKQTVIIKNYPNNDWEDIAADKDHIYIGDFGNNYGVRKNLRILVVDKASITDVKVVHVTANAINFSYADQRTFTSNNRNNYDCESLISIGDSLYLFSKDRGDNHTRVYCLPKTPGTYKISPYTEFNVSGRICGASYNPQTNQLALIGYMAYTTNSFLWIMDNFAGQDFFSGTKERIEIGKNRVHWKTEGIAYDSNDRLFISCERTDTENAALYILDYPKK